MSLEAVFTGVAFVAGVLAILAAVLGSSRKLGRRIDALDEKLTARIDAVDTKAAARSDAVETRAAARSDVIEQKADGMEQRLIARIDAVDAKAAARSDVIEQKAAARSDALEAKLERYHDELVEFRIETKESFGRVEAHLARHDERLALWERFVWARSNAMPEPDLGRPQGAGLPPVEPQKIA